MIDRGAGGDPQPEWHKLRAALRPTDTLVIATLPAPGKHRKHVLAELHALRSAGTCQVEILPGARLNHPGRGTATDMPQSTASPLSAGQLYRYRRRAPHQLPEGP